MPGKRCHVNITEAQKFRKKYRCISLITCPLLHPLIVQSSIRSFYFYRTTIFSPKIIRKQTSGRSWRRAVIRLVQLAIFALLDGLRGHDLPVGQQRVLGLFKAIVEMRLDVNTESGYPVDGLLEFVRSLVLFAVLQTLCPKGAQQQGKKQVQDLMWSEQDQTKVIWKTASSRFEWLTCPNEETLILVFQ